MVCRKKLWSNTWRTFHILSRQATHPTFGRHLRRRNILLDMKAILKHSKTCETWRRTSKTTDTKWSTSTATVICFYQVASDWEKSMVRLCSKTKVLPSTLIERTWPWKLVEVQRESLKRVDSSPSTCLSRLSVRQSLQSQDTSSVSCHDAPWTAHSSKHSSNVTTTGCRSPRLESQRYSIVLQDGMTVLGKHSRIWASSPLWNAYYIHLYIYIRL